MRKQRKGLQWEMLPRVHPRAAGLDIGAREIWACVSSDGDAEPVLQRGSRSGLIPSLAAASSDPDQQRTRFD